MSVSEAQAPILVSLDTAGQLVGVTRRKIEKMIRDGDLPLVKIGRASRVPVASLHEYADRHTVGEGNGSRRLTTAQR